MLPKQLINWGLSMQIYELMGTMSFKKPLEEEEEEEEEKEEKEEQEDLSKLDNCGMLG